MTDKELFKLYHKSVDGDEEAQVILLEELIKILLDVRRSTNRRQKVFKRPTKNKNDIIVG